MLSFFAPWLSPTPRWKESEVGYAAQVGHGDEALGHVFEVLSQRSAPCRLPKSALTLFRTQHHRVYLF